MIGMDDRRSRGPPLFGLFLVAIGIVLLLQTLNIIAWQLWFELWRFWPVLLVIIGANLILGRRFPWITTVVTAALVTVSIVGAVVYAESEHEAVTRRIAEPLGETTFLEVSADFSVGSLTIDSLPDGSPNILEGVSKTSCGYISTSFHREGQAAYLDIERGDSVPPCPWPTDLSLSLSRAPDIEVYIANNASSVELDLTDLKITVLRVDANASSVSIEMPGNAGEVRAPITANASSIDLHVSSEVAVRLWRDSVLSSIDISRDLAGYTRKRTDEQKGEFDSDDTFMGRRLNGVFETSNYSDAPNRIDIELDVNLSSVTVR